MTNILSQISETGSDEALKALYPWIWAYRSQILIKGNPFMLAGHEYQIDIMNCDAKRQCAMKGSQLGFTEVEVLKALHGMIYGKYPQGVLYLFPTRDDVTDFSKGRFQPLISDNVDIGRHIQNTDAVNIKRINDAFLYLRGARVSHKIEGIKKTSSQLKSVPADKIIFDEVDEMDPEMVQLAIKRMGHSEAQEEVYLSTPSIPDFGIDKLYKQESDQRIWMIKCQHCGKETCLELEFPNCLKERSDGSIYRACIHCGKEIYSRDGQWIIQYPDKSQDMIGRLISRLNSTYADPKQILNDFNNPPNGNLAEVYNSDLGTAYIAAENRLTVNDVYNTCGLYPMPTKHIGPCAMGVDVGKMLHVVVGYKPNNARLRAAYFARVSNFNDVADIAKRFNVSSTVIELEPETRAVRQYRKANNGVFLFDYNEHQKHSPNFDSKEGLVTMNRTELCDATHDLVTTPGRFEIPRRNTEVEEYAKEMSNIAKVLEEDKQTGSRTYRYRKLGEDHYRHATNFMLLASMRIGVCRREEARTNPKDAWGDWSKDGQMVGNWMSS